MKRSNRVFRIFLLFLIYIIVGYTGSLIILQAGSSVLVLPTLTLAVLAVYYLGIDALPAIFAGAFLLSFLGIYSFDLESNYRLLPSFLIATGSALSAFMGGRCLQVRIRDHGGDLFSVSRMFSFLFFIVLIPSVVNAAFIIVTELIVLPVQEPFLHYIQWVQAGGIGILMIVPFIFAWTKKDKLVFSRYGVLELFMLLIILIPIIVLISSDFLNDPVKNFLAGYFLLPVYLWLAIRFDSKITTLVVLITMVLLAGVSTVMTTNHYMTEISDHPELLLQGFMFIIMLVTLVMHSFLRERIRLIHSLSKSESNLKAVIENMPVALVVMNKNGEKGYVNHNFMNLTGYDAGDLPTIDSWFLKAYPDPDYRAKAKETWQKTIEKLPEAGTVEEEFKIVTKNGQIRDIHFVMSKLQEKFLVALSDMTQRKQMVERIMESERRQNTLIQNLQGMIFQCRNDTNRSMNFVSEGAFSLTGFLPSDFTGGRVDFSSLIVGKFRNEVLQRLTSAVKKGEPYEIQYQLETRNGEIKWVSEKGKGFYSDKGVCLGIEGLIIDITDRIHILESLRISEQRYKSLFDNVPLSLWEDDYSQAITYLRSLEEQHDGDLRSYLLSDHAHTRELVRRIRIIDLNRSSVKLYGGVNREKLVKSTDMIFVEEDYESLVNIMLRLMNGETYIENKATNITIGGQVKTLSISWCVMPGHESDLSRVLVTIVDVTDLTKAKQAILDLNQQLEEKVIKRTMELDRANKELEAFSYSVSHDLKAPLRAIKGFSSLLKGEIGNELPVKPARYLNHVIENVDNMTRLINDLLQFSRLGRRSLNIGEVNTTMLVKTVWDELTDLESDRNFHFEHDDLPMIRADESLLRQVFVNLLSNAVKFTSGKEKGSIWIRGSRRDHNWLFSVGDNGIGFEQKFEEKIFKVFQRLHTQDEYEGSGVGLALVQRIVHRHGGRVWADGKPGEGAVFHFTIPVEIDSE